MSTLTLTDEEFDFYASFVEDTGIRKSTYRFVTHHKISKRQDEQQNVFGWASVGILPDGKIVTDHQGDVLDRPEEIEKSAYDFVLNCRDGGTMHIGKGSKSTLIESFVSTPEKWAAMGIPSGVLPVGWWAGFHVNDPVAWDGIKKGRYKMFSVQGRGNREVIM